MRNRKDMPHRTETISEVKNIQRSKYINADLFQKVHIITFLTCFQPYNESKMKARFTHTRSHEFISKTFIGFVKYRICGFTVTSIVIDLIFIFYLLFFAHNLNVNKIMYNAEKVSVIPKKNLQISLFYFLINFVIHFQKLGRFTRGSFKSCEKQRWDSLTFADMCSTCPQL